MTTAGDSEKTSNLAVSLAIASLITWLLPIIGFPTAIAGILVNSRLQSNSRRKIYSVLLCLSVMGLIASIGSAVYGYNRAVTRQILTETQEDQAIRQSECLNTSHAKYVASWQARDKDGDGKLSPLDGSINITTELYNDYIDCYITYNTSDSEARIAELRIRRQQELDKLNTLLEAAAQLTR